MQTLPTLPASPSRLLEHVAIGELSTALAVHTGYGADRSISATFNVNFGREGASFREWSSLPFPFTADGERAALVKFHALVAAASTVQGISPVTAALRDAAVAVMPADLGALLMAATDTAALIEAFDVVANDQRCNEPWFDAASAADASACFDVREFGTLPAWWDGGYDDAADRHAATLTRQVAA